MTIQNRYCVECSGRVKGRRDKMFCCEKCRNEYNNALNRDATITVKNINNILRKNRRILQDYAEKTTKSFFISQLIEEGFKFDYFTQMYGETKFCYEFGYRFDKHDKVHIIQKELNPL